MKTTHISSSQVRRAFSGAAGTYDEHAVLQREVADRLLQHIEFTKINPRRILDIGCGTGYFTRLLCQRFKKADITALDLSDSMVRSTSRGHSRRMPWHGKRHHVVSDGCLLPFADGAFDLVCSSLTMQWVTDPILMMQEMRRVLAPGGLVLFSTFGRRTLAELRQSLAEIASERAGLVLPFPDVTSLGDSLMTLAVELPVTDTDLFTLTYPDTMALVRELKNIGASSAAIRNRPSGLYGRALLKQLEAIYSARHSSEGGRIHATFEVLYAQAWHKEAGYRPAGRVIPIQPDRAT
ncbi:MAG: malonyl-ACP O-methyltransferase BioC [Mariprofundaceae bacterium]|nr:malonyl-ACP O-methyltransferase BioC [Mariprofundaceae bacterium]